MNYLEIINSLPYDLKEIVKDGNWIENNIGHSKSRVFYININNENLYLKIAPLSMTEVEHEAKVFEWLKDKLPVPTVKYFLKSDKIYLLMTEVKGQDASRELNILTPKETIKILASSLKLIHSLDIRNCPFFQPIDSLLNQVKKNKANINKTDLIDKLFNSIPENTDKVFTHGDYSLPNIIINNGKLSGFIDMGFSGIRDKYLDFADLIRSIKYNFKDDTEELVDLFFKEYGLINLDKDKLDFYILLCDLF